MPGQKDENYPKIRKVIFIIDKERKYSFDVDQNIAIYNLKMMIISAASLGRVSLRIFHEGKEYTQNDPDLLDFLFPTLDTVIFTLSIDENSLNKNNELTKINLLSKKYCSKHMNKYPYCFCYTGNKSICSDCILSNEHLNHEYKEKYDYLQSSQDLTEELFSTMKNDIKCTDEKYINEFRDKLSVKYFPSLVKILKEVENKLNGLISTFIKKEKKNFLGITKNIISLRENCEDGLDCLKEKICIENLMIDDDIFLTFDKKYKSISQEKNKILKNIEQFDKFKTQLKIIENAVEKIYNELHDVLNKYLNSDIYDKINKEIETYNILPIKTKDAFNNLVADIKKKPKTYLGKKKQHSDK